MGSTCTLCFVIWRRSRTSLPLDSSWTNCQWRKRYLQAAEHLQVAEHLPAWPLPTEHCSCSCSSRKVDRSIGYSPDWSGAQFVFQRRGYCRCWSRWTLRTRKKRTILFGHVADIVVAVGGGALVVLSLPLPDDQSCVVLVGTTKIPNRTSSLHLESFRHRDRRVTVAVVVAETFAVDHVPSMMLGHIVAAAVDGDSQDHWRPQYLAVSFLRDLAHHYPCSCHFVVASDTPSRLLSWHSQPYHEPWQRTIQTTDIPCPFA
mmetsp:Transcript_20092/g.43251  ORF Transcript_20092/g.43251 Transcript_20092/m.43251 type:complete len:259 (-) Transcript_20092:497-1273(-)